MMTKKTMTIISVFMVVALTAVGFAAWLIVGTIDAETQGSFVANELDDKYFSVEVEFDTTSKGNITFGTPKDDTTPDNTIDWLTYKQGDAQENLTATAIIKFIPDAGFSTDRDMAYFLDDNDDSTTNTYRTIRVKIDVAETVTSSAENKYEITDNYKWFDWAVQLGYIEYPTVQLVDSKGDKSSLSMATTNFSETTGEVSIDTTKTISSIKDFTFENGCFYVDLDINAFKVDSTNKFATANIEFTFAWDIDFETTKKVGENSLVSYNPYNYFNIKSPDDTLTVAQYLEVTESKDSDGKVIYGYNLKTTSTENDNNPANDNSIRYKDLAQRMLDYLRDYINYDESSASGIQFSIELSEGTAKTVSAS